MRQLLSATPSPYARKVRIALAEKGIPFTLVTEVPWHHSTTKTKLYNPLEKLPVLIEDDGRACYESHHILEYLELKYPNTIPLVSADVDARLAAKQIEVIADGVCDALVLSFFERQRAPESQSKEWLARQMRKVDGGLEALNAQVSADREFMIGAEFGLADIAAGSVCGYINTRFKDYMLEDKWPALGRYWRRLEERQSFQDTVPAPQKIDDKIV